MAEQIFELPEDSTNANLKRFGNVRWTDSDMQEFAEWCSFNYEWNPFYNKWRKSSQSFDQFMSNIDDAPATAQLLEEFKVWKEANK